jgi:TfoX/Sxy family transcriptional regulator of competence genes
VTVAAYYEAPSEALDDPEGLSGWAADALRAARSVHRR